MTAMNRRTAGLFAWCLLASAAFAQTPTTPPENNGQPVELSPFEVHVDENRGYVASETLTGTRVATQIKDLPYSVNVITSEFFEDFAMFQIDDTLTQVGGLTGLDVGGGFNLRGFVSSSQLRDGFYRQGRYGQTNIDRVEIIKGPNAGIYGRSSPGGMVNMISKLPKPVDAQKLTVRGGSFDTLQGTLEATGTLGSPKTYYLAIVSQLNRGGDVDWFHMRENQAYLALKHDFDNGGHTLFSAEYFKQFRHSQLAAAPMITDLKNTASNLDDEVIGYAKDLARSSAFGPHSENSRSAVTLRTSYDRQLNKVFTFRAGAQLFSAKLQNFNANTGFGAITINSTTPANNLTSTRGATPNRGIINEDGGGVQLDLVARYSLAKGAINNKTLVTVDFNDYYRFDPTRNSSATAALATWGAAGSGRVVALNPDYTPVSALTYFEGTPEDGLGAATRYTRRRISVVGGQFRQESRWYHERLLTYFGARFDKVHFSQLEYITTVNGVTPTMDSPVAVKRDVNQAKPNAGALFKVKENLRVYANYSESYFINQGENPVDVASPTYKSETAKGWDYGIKGALFDDRLNYTIGFYDIRRYGVRVTDSVETPVGSGTFVDVVRSDGDQAVKGWEADVTWSINHSWSTGLSFAHVDASYRGFGSKNPQAVGRAVQNISPENGGAWIKYNGEGRFKGFSANLGATYIAETPTESPIAGDTVAIVGGVPTVTRSTNQWKLTVPAVTLWNLGLSYRWKQNAHASHSVRLNVNNAFNNDYLKVGKTLGDPRGVYASYTLSFSKLLKH
jgi:iron complex outermembrane receptor protein